MPTAYTVDDPLDHDAIASLVSKNNPGSTVEHIERMQLGSTNLLYTMWVSGTPVILKVSHRPDRIRARILEKEIAMLEKFHTVDLPIPIPKVLWKGETVEGYPAALLTHLTGEPIAKLMQEADETATAFRTLGVFNAMLHTMKHPVIDEFETERPPFDSFPAYVAYWLNEWQPLLDQVEPRHIRQDRLTIARQFILKNLHHFDDAQWVYVHSDLSGENVLGILHHGSLVLTGVCDFETMQTGPAEYDLGTAWNNYFVHNPSLEAPFMEGYTSQAALHPHVNERLIVISLFRALRYIKRSVKYREEHYYDHDRAFLESWLQRIQ